MLEFVCFRPWTRGWVKDSSIEGASSWLSAWMSTLPPLPSPQTQALPPQPRCFSGKSFSTETHHLSERSRVCLSLSPLWWVFRVAVLFPWQRTSSSLIWPANLYRVSLEGKRSAGEVWAEEKEEQQECEKGRSVVERQVQLSIPGLHVSPTVWSRFVSSCQQTGWWWVRRGGSGGTRVCHGGSWGDPPSAWGQHHCHWLSSLPFIYILIKSSES